MTYRMQYLLHIRIQSPIDKIHILREEHLEEEGDIQGPDLARHKPCLLTVQQMTKPQEPGAPDTIHTWSQHQWMWAYTFWQYRNLPWATAS